MHYVLELTFYLNEKAFVQWSSFCGPYIIKCIKKYSVEKTEISPLLMLFPAWGFIFSGNETLGSH